ncbi:MAG: sigma-54 interaction domain-containing protein [Butyricicoccus sp.]
MNYKEVMNVLSQAGMGALLLSREGRILEINETGDRLLHGKGALVGERLKEIAPELCAQGKAPRYQNIAFGEYLLRCSSPEADDLPERTELVVFRDATNDACHDMLVDVVNQLSECVSLYDAEGRVYLLNDAVVQMESIITQDVRGDLVTDLYKTSDESELPLPQVLRTKRPIVNKRMRYTTRFGREMDVVASDYPLMRNGQVLGGVCIMEDCSTIDSLQKQIIDLQQKLTEQQGKKKVSKTKSSLTAKWNFGDIVYNSANMKRVITQCSRVAKNDSAVMIYGETGTGKEMFAQSIHNASGRRNGPFLAINCAAIPENLLESLLFGTEKGAYTGSERRPGLFEQASGGSLLLDEINSMDISLQSKLLRVLQEGSLRRVGGAEEIQVDVRVLSAINIPPQQAIQENKLRQDLYYRLGVVNITVPPLRERREDILLLSKTFVMQCNKKMGRSISGIDEDTLEVFRTYNWPGNVRELQHAVEHAMNVLPDDASFISPQYLPAHILSEQNKPESAERQGDSSLNSRMRGMERSAICAVLRENNGNISASARQLEMSRQNLQYRIKRYKIDVAALIKE